MAKNINLDIVRIFATFLVLTVHISQQVGFNFAVGAKGVQIFFILSGYLSFKSLAKESSPMKYYRNRLIRILPTYWFCLALVYAKDLLLGIHTTSLSATLKGQCSYKFLRYVFLIHDVIPSDNWDLWNNHNALWTMSCFYIFYILAPFLYKIIKKFYLGLFLLYILIYIRQPLAWELQKFFAFYPPEAHIDWYSKMNPFMELYCFLFGAILYLAIKENKQHVYAIVTILTIALTDGSKYLYELLSVLLIYIAVSQQPFLENKKLRHIINTTSKTSFTLYLLHPLILQIYGLLKLDINSKFIYVLLLYTSCVFISFILYYGIIVKIENSICKLVHH